MILAVLLLPMLTTLIISIAFSPKDSKNSLVECLALHTSFVFTMLFNDGIVN